MVRPNAPHSATAEYNFAAAFAVASLLALLGFIAWTLLLLVLMNGLHAAAQTTIKLSGKVINTQNEPVPGATITIEEVDNIGRIEIAGTNKKSIDDAMRIIKGIVAVPEVGEVYKGKVRSIMPYGAFVEFLPGKDGLLHISEIDWKRLETVEEAGIKEGDEIDVKLLDIDPKTGKFKLSRKVLLPRPERQERPEKK